METKYMAMVEVADEKYMKLFEYIYQLKSGSDVDYDKIFKLLNSIHKDEVKLIVDLYEAEQFIKRSKEELQVPSFMMK